MYGQRNLLLIKAWRFRIRKKRDSTFHVAKAKCTDQQQLLRGIHTTDRSNAGVVLLFSMMLLSMSASVLS